LLKKERVIRGRPCHGDKGYFGKENIKHCKAVGLKPNIVPKEELYTDLYLRKYIAQEYDDPSRKETRGLIEGVFGGFQTENDMRMRCRTTHHRNLFVALLGLKHNLRTYLRVVQHGLMFYFAPTPAIAKAL